MKSQTASEYLMILAAVLIIIGIYLAASGRFGEIISRPDRSEYWLTTPIGISSIAVGNVTSLTIMNNNPYDIILTTANITVEGKVYEMISEEQEFFIQTKTQQRINFEESIECERGSLLQIEFHWIFTNTQIDVEREIIPDRRMNIYCN